jgi:hypothetical protein
MQNAPTMKSILDVTVSCFASYYAQTDPKPVNLLTWLTSPKYRPQVEAIRATADKAERDRIKATLPAITPSGEFTRRTNTALVRHSGLVCLDIDRKGNEDHPHYADLKAYLCRIPNVAYCGLSVSGTGYFVLIPVSEPEQHSSHFNALRGLFLERFGIRVDNTGDVSRLRGYSYDANGFFRHDAEVFTRLHVPTPTTPRETRRNAPRRANVPETEASILRRCIALVEAATDGNKDTTLLKAATLAGGYVASGVLDEQTAVGCLEDAVSRLPNVASFTHAQRTIQNGIRNGKLRPLYLEQDPHPHRWAIPTPHAPANVSNYVTSLAGWCASPGGILRPRPDQLEYLTPDVPYSEYPAEWDARHRTQSKVVGGKPYIGPPILPPPKTFSDATPCVSASEFHKWQQQHPYFGQMGLASLTPEQQATLRGNT